MQHGPQVAQLRVRRVRLALLVGGDHHAVAVQLLAEAAQRHGEAALGVGAAPGVGGQPHPVLLLLGQVPHPAHPALVPRPLDPLHHLPDVAHRAALEGESPVLTIASSPSSSASRPVSRVQTSPPVSLHRRRRAARRGRGPAPCTLDRAGPRLDVADRVAAGEHHTGDHPVADGRLAAGREDRALVAAQREVPEGVAGAVLDEQRAQPLLVLLAQLGDRAAGPQRQVDGGDRDQQAEAAERVRRPRRRPGRWCT